MSENHSAEPQADAERVIKKYPNRRLYDTSTSTYITLAEVKQLVIAGEAVVVRDAKTGDDLTRSILLQIILEEEAGGAPMFSEAVLAHIIRFYGHAMQGFMGAYLEKNIQMFTEFQNRMAAQTPGFSPEKWAQMVQASPMASMAPGAMGSYMEQSQALWAQMQQQMHKQTEQMFDAFGLKKK